MPDKQEPVYPAIGDFETPTDEWSREELARDLDAVIRDNKDLKRIILGLEQGSFTTDSDLAGEVERWNSTQ